MPKIELDGLPVVEAPESETITVAVSADDLEAGNTKKPERHPVAITLRRQRGVDDARGAQNGKFSSSGVNSGSDTTRPSPCKVKDGASG